MKREHPIPRKLSDNNTISSATTPGGGACSGSSSAGGGGATSNNYYTAEAANGKSKLWEEAEKDAAVDELLAVLGYKVPSSAMVEVAHKLERLDQAMGNVQEDDLSHFASETVHYNPSDLSSWLEYMISELNPLPSNFDSFYSTFEDPFFKPTATDSSTVTTIDNSHHLQQQRRQNHNPSALIFQDFSSDYNLKAIPGKAIYPQNQPSVPQLKRLKSSPGTQSESSTTQQVGATRLQDESTRPVVLVDSQENGIRLVHMLMACAEAIQQENLELANALVKHIGILAVSQAGAMRKVATYFAKALAQRIYRIYPQNPQVSAFSDLLQMHFYETCPYMKFAHFTANQAILEAFTNAKRVHVIDFGIKQGMQWPALLQALALRTGCPSSFRLTGIGPPSHDNTDHLQEVGLRLAQLAETIHVEFEYRGFVTNSLADLEASMLDLRENEVVAVNSVFELHQLLARPGAIEKVFSVVREMKPMIFTVVEQEANHNGPVFLDRFTESLHYYSTLFDSLEGCCGGGDAAATAVSNQYKVMSEEYLGRQIYNLVACEGVHRIERHESLNQWRNRFSSAGLEPVHLGSNAFKQAGMLLALFAGGDGYKVEENNGCLMLGWHTRPLIATSAWKLK